MHDIRYAIRPLVRTPGFTLAALLVLLGAVGLVLLIACANVPNFSSREALAGLARWRCATRSGRAVAGSCVR